jgi:hypothetical protein
MRRFIARQLAAMLAAGFVLAAPAFAGSAGSPAASTKGQRDPFEVKPRPKPTPAKKVLLPSEIAPPGFTARLATCETRGSAFGSSVESTPCPYLVSELKLSGIYRGETLAAVAVARPTNEAVFLEVGDRLFDGEVVAITEATASTNARVTFKKTTRFRAKGGERSEVSSVTLELAP